ncbi:vancomycin resistance protein, partial [Klebsiella oxytoca]
MNGLIDVAKYREEYADLDAAFGDNWDAYLNHYLTYGAKERRDTGTDFNALDYAGRYEDLQDAF